MWGLALPMLHFSHCLGTVVRLPRALICKGFMLSDLVSAYLKAGYQLASKTQTRIIFRILEQWIISRRQPFCSTEVCVCAQKPSKDSLAKE